MLTGPLLIIVFLLSILLLLFLVIKLKLSPFLALLIICILTGFAVNMPVRLITDNLVDGFGNTLKSIGIVIGMGIILGKILSESGAAETISNNLINNIGRNKAALALAVTGLLVSIPVFFDAAFVILIPLVKNISKITKIPLITLTTALSVGLIVSHNMIIPTPGPVDVGTSLQVSFGSYAIIAILVALPAVLIGGWIYGVYLGKKTGEIPLEGISGESGSIKDKPGVFISYFSLLLPILFILIGNTFTLILQEGSFTYNFADFLGDKNVALLISVLSVILILRRYILKSFNKLVTEAAESSGMILLITGAGGAFGYIVNQSGIGNYLVDTFTGMNISLLVTSFILAAILRGALGSSTVALVTTSSILGPIVLQSSVSPLMVALAICTGGMCMSLPNDSGFWVVSRFAGLNIQQTLKSWTLGSSLAGLAGFLIILVINSFIG